MDLDKILTVMSDIGGKVLEFASWLGGKIIEWIAYSYVILGDYLETIDVPIFTKTKILGTLRVSGTLLAGLIMYAVILNIITYCEFSRDKKIAQSNKKKTQLEKRVNRRSEAHLLRLCFLGGSLGGFIAIHVCRHKTKVKKFTIGVTLMLVIQICLYSIALGFFGFWIYFR